MIEIFSKNFTEIIAVKKVHLQRLLHVFLQQAFGLEAFPIDTWVKTFIYYPLGMSPKNNGKSEPTKPLQNDLYSNYNHLDKLEKLIWASSMGNKTNKTEFLDILWCQRYGTDQNSSGPCRGVNPLSCSKCILKDECTGYQSIKNESIYISDDMDSLESNVRDLGLFFGIYTEQGTPRKVYVLQRNNFTERDSHSGLAISTATNVANGQLTVDSFVSLL